MKNLSLGRQEAEDLVDLLEENQNRILHDDTAAALAADIRELFGMAPRAGNSVESFDYKAECVRLDEENRALRSEPRGARGDVDGGDI